MKKKRINTIIGVLILFTIILTLQVNATMTYITDTNGFTLPSSDATANPLEGLRIIVNYNTTLVNITKHSSSGCTQGFLLSSSKSLIKFVAFSGNNANINYNITQGTTYFVVCNNTVNYNRQYQGTVTYPVSGTAINYTGGMSGTTNYTDYAFEIMNVTTSTETTMANNLTINAINNWNSTNITIFNATMTNGNGTTYTFTTTTSQINTTIPMNSTALWNITITSYGMTTNYTYNYNISTNYVGYMQPTDTTPPSIYCSINGLTNITGYTISLNITITEPYLTNTTIIPEGLATETNNSHRTNHYYGNTTWNITNITGIGNYTIQVNARDFNDNYANYTCNYTIIPNNTYTTIYVYDYLNTTLLNNLQIYSSATNTTTYNNPYNITTSTIISKTTPTFNLTLNIIDLNYYYLPQNISFNINRFTNNFSTSMTPNKLILSFVNSSGNITRVQGFIIDTTPSSRGFNDTSIIIIQSNLSLGKVTVIFNDDTNWTQYYEYNNDYTTYINETLGIIPKTNLWYGYILVKDQTNSPLKDTTIRATAIIPHWYDNGTIGQLIGQRLTEDDGYTFLIADKSTQMLLSISKDGYTPQEKIISFGDESYTRADPLQIILIEGNNTGTKDLWGYIPNEFNNLSQNIQGTIVAWDYSKIEIEEQT